MNEFENKTITEKVLSFEDKVASSGKQYSRFKFEVTGWISCFEADITNNLKTLVNRTVTVEIAENGSFKNVRKFIKLEEISPSDESSAPKPKNMPSFNQKTMYVSYAKDVFCCLVAQPREEKVAPSELMKISIDVIQQAQNAF